MDTHVLHNIASFCDIHTLTSFMTTSKENNKIGLNDDIWNKLVYKYLPNVVKCKNKNKTNLKLKLKKWFEFVNINLTNKTLNSSLFVNKEQLTNLPSTFYSQLCTNNYGQHFCVGPKYSSHENICFVDIYRTFYDNNCDKLVMNKIQCHNSNIDYIELEHGYGSVMISNCIYTFGGKLKNQTNNNFYKFVINRDDTFSFYNMNAFYRDQNIPQQRWGHTMVTCCNHNINFIVIYGGFQTNKTYDDIWVWSQEFGFADMTQFFMKNIMARGGHSSIVVNNVLYVLGGLNTSHCVFDEFYKLDLIKVTDTYLQLFLYPNDAIQYKNLKWDLICESTSIHGLMSCIDQTMTLCSNCIIIQGGRTVRGLMFQPNIYVYNIANNTWIEYNVGRGNVHMRTKTCSFLTSNGICYFGGVSCNEQPSNIPCHFEFLNHIISS